MKNLIPSLALVVAVTASTALIAQTPSVNDRLTEGKLLTRQAYNHYDKNLLLQAHDIFQHIYKADTSNYEALYNVTLVEYKLLEMGARPGNEQLFGQYYEGAIENAQMLSDQKEFAAEGKTLSAAIYMMKIASSPMSAVTLSSKIYSLLDEAEKIKPEYPRIYLIRGMMKFNTPGMFGGSYKDALKNFNISASLYEKQNVDTAGNDWGYVEALTWTGRSQEKLENFEAALYSYKKVLSVEPDFSWVKYVLLPKLEEKLTQKN
jgi:tetratricopeptide (TPR) repeat protein